MDNQHTQIDRYLLGEMTAAERTEFESRLATDTALQQELMAQQQLINAIRTAGIKNEFGRAIRKRFITKQLLRWGIAAVIVAAVVIAGIKSNWFAGKHVEGASRKSAVESFEINAAADTIIETKDGVVFAIPAHAFISNGNTVQLEIRTALTAYDIMEQGLSTVSNGELLQTAGMFYINGFENGQPVSLQKEIAVSVPAREINPAMQLFDGVQDTNGHVNWVNPKPVEKKLRTFDITSLDFYPPDYIPALKALQKNYRDKRYTDSLYYSFSGYPFAKSIAADSKKDTAKAESVEKVLEVGSRNEPGIDYSASEDRFQHTQSDTSIAPARDSVYKSDYDFEINPARIKAIWNKKFDNTILATKEFEERLRYMHTLCTAACLDVYLANLSQPLYVSDEQCAALSSGDVKKKFLEFAARKDGAVQIATGTQAKLSAYFQQKYTVYKAAAEKTYAEYEATLDKLNRIAAGKRDAAVDAEIERTVRNYREELCINLTEAYRQTGVRRTCNDTVVPPTHPYYNITITTTGWKNLDMYVIEATANRQSMSYTDPFTGKTAKLVYSDISIQVEDEADYDRVLVYLIPDSLSSFQRVAKQGTVYKEKLNSLFQYQAVAIGYKGKDIFYYHQPFLQSGNYTFSLAATNEKELRTALKVFSVNRRVALENDISYQLFEQQEIIRQVQVQQDKAFREQVAAAIFHCHREGDPVIINPATLPSAK